MRNLADDMKTLNVSSLWKERSKIVKRGCMKMMDTVLSAGQEVPE